MSADSAEENYYAIVIRYVDMIEQSKNNTNIEFDFTQPHIKRSVRYVYPLFVFLHSVVGLLSLIGNIGMIIAMGKRRLCHDQTFFFLGNLAFCDIIKCVCVLPISLANMLIENWIYGSFMCFFLPMIQIFPIHASMLTFLMIAIDRYRLIVNPFKTRVPAGLCTIAVWVCAICVVLPLAVYIKYIDLGAFLGEHFEGVGICYINKERQIEEYLRAMFVILYVMPLAIIAFLYVKVSAELKSRENSAVVVHYSVANGGTPSAASQNEDFAPKVTWAKEEAEHTQTNTSVPREYNSERTTHDSDDDIDLAKEKRTQNYLIAMVTLFAMCWCPMNILLLVHYFIHESDHNRTHIDVTYITFIWFGFLSTCVNPLLFASWRMPSSTKDRLKGYFRFSNRRRSSSQVSRTTCTDSFCPNTPSPREPRKATKVRVRYGNELSPYHAENV